jgi:hypothetical protein
MREFFEGFGAAGQQGDGEVAVGGVREDACYTRALDIITWSANRLDGGLHIEHIL